MTSELRRFGVVTAMLCAITVTAQAHVDDINDNLAAMSLEQLMSEPVTSVSKKAGRVSDSAAAIAVVTQQDIRRLGITTLPDALRLVPGIDVARISSNAWAISARGFNNQFAGKLLVLIDGRSLYTPATAGVFWNAQDLMIEDVDRIEVIRGPGATLWGANAVNGVINVITKSAEDTQGGLMSAMVGTEFNAQLAARFGAAIGPDLHYRVYAKYLDQAGLSDSTHDSSTGDWHTTKGGFRLDYAASGADSLTLQGDIYSGEAGSVAPSVTLNPPSSVESVMEEANSGADVIGRWTHAYSTDSALTLQTYVDHVDQGDGSGIERRNTYDIEVQHRFVWRANDLLWGAGFRKISIEEVTEGLSIAWMPPLRDFQIRNFFLQDDFTVVPDRLHAIVGVKYEHDTLVAATVNPNFRLLWTPAANQTVWGAVSQAPRTPSLFELDARANLSVNPAGPGAPPVVVAFVPNPALGSEKLTAYEMGYRVAPLTDVSLDFAGFANHYSDGIIGISQTPRLETTFGMPDLLVPIVTENAGNGWSYGLEAAAHWQPLPNWQLTGSYTFLRMRIAGNPGPDRESPQQQAQLRSYLDLPRHLQLNAALYYVGPIGAPTGVAIVPVRAYVRADLGLVWNPYRSLTLGVWGQNLLQREHLEYASQISSALTELPRSVFAKVSWNFL